MTTDKNTAVLSPCGKYRYSLARRVASPHDEMYDRIVTFIMLNPSTADAETDDPTIRKCKEFARRWGYTVLQVVNLFDYRATKPEDLKKASKPCSDINLDVIRATCDMSSRVICAWGTHGTYGRQNKKVMDLLWNFQLYALDITKDGHPKHPLYIPYDKKPVLLRAAQTGEW